VGAVESWRDQDQELKLVASSRFKLNNPKHLFTTTTMPSPAPMRSPIPSPASSRPPSISVQSPLQLTPHNPFFPGSVHSSRQNSLDIPLRAPSPRPTKRNRSALRQFYGLSATGEVLPELDRDDFDPATYVEKLLAEKGVRELLAVENGLVNGKGVSRGLAQNSD
jgi:hypothetical protein